MNIVVECPHCKYPVEILEINCAIFRHAVLKVTGVQINPHTSKIDCDKLVEEGRIYGCGKPFRIIKINNAYNAIICDYI